MMKSGRIPAKANIRKIWLFGFALMIFCLCGSNAFAMDLMGPPVAEMEKGMFRGGIEYSFSTIDLKLIEGQGELYLNSDFVYSGDVESLTIENLKINTLYANVGYGIFENCDAFIRMGMASATFGDSLWEEGEDFDSNIDLALGAGIKSTFYEGFDWKIGGIFQINRSELDGELDSSSWVIPQPHFVEISTTEMQIAIGVTYMWSSRVSIYGGPFVHFISGDFDYELNKITEDLNIINREYSWEINEGPIYGGYIGAQIQIAKNYSANIEYQHTSNPNVFGVNIMMRY